MRLLCRQASSMDFAPLRGLRTSCALLLIGFAVPSFSNVSAFESSQEQQDADCISDRSVFLQLPSPHLELAGSADIAYPDSQMVLERESFIPKLKENTKTMMKEMKMKSNSEGDLEAFMSSFVVNTIVVLMVGAFFCAVYRRYPLVYMDNVKKGLAPEVADTRLGWVEASWKLSSEEIEHTGGLDAAMLVEFTHLGLRVCLTIGVPMIVILCPLHVFAGGHHSGNDKLSQLGMGNVVEGEGARWVYWVHACFVWYVVVMTQRAIFKAQELFLQRRNHWVRQMPKPRSTTVLVEGIPQDCRTDAALKAEFDKLFPGDKVASAYVVMNTAKLDALAESHKNAQQSLDEANFEWQALGHSEDMRPQCRDWTFGKMVDKINFYAEQKRSAALEVAQERQVLGDPSQSLEVHSDSGFVTFHNQRDAAIALCLKVRADESVFEMSTPPDPADVQYSDLYMDPNTKSCKAFLGYSCIVGVFFGFTPIVLAISSIVNLTALRRTLPVVDELVVAFPMTERLLEGVLASAALTLFMSFLPTILMLIFDTLFPLKAGRWAQHRLQIWYFWFQVLFVLLITAVGSSLWDTMLTLVNHPTLIFELLANRLPSTTHFYLNYMVMQWVVHALNLTRYVNLSKFKALSVICEEDRAKELSEPEDQDYYGMGARSARFTLNLVIALVYCSLCPLITVVTGVNFLISKVVYSYLLVFAESRKPDLGGHFWVTQLRHTQYGLFIYVALMVGVLWSRAATFGPTVVAAPALVYMVRSYFKFQSEFQWEFVPFEEFTKDDVKKEWGAVRASSRTNYRQPGLTEPELTEK